MPLVLTRSKAVFLHIPKTGGTWVRYALQQSLVPWMDYGYQHATYKESDDLFPKAVRFTVVRNPFDWYASYWADRMIHGWGGGWLLGQDCNEDHFPHFIRDATTKHPGWLSEFYKQFVVPGVTVLKTESLFNDLSKLLLDLREQWAPENLPGIVNPGASLQPFKSQVVYTDEMTKQVIRSEGRNFFSKYGYSLTPPLHK